MNDDYRLNDWSDWLLGLSTILFMEYRGLLPWGRGQGVKQPHLTTPFHLMPRLKIRGALLPYTFMARHKNEAFTIFLLKPLNCKFQNSYMHITESQLNCVLQLSFGWFMNFMENQIILTSSNFTHSSFGNMIFCSDNCMARTIRKLRSSTRCAGNRLRASFTSGLSSS